ncbi:MAG: peptidoglycan editing factor PgeF [bacterium]
MRKIVDNIVYYQFLLFEKYSREVKHLYTTRIGGYSQKPYNSLNLGLHVGDSHTDVVKNRDLACSTLGHPLDSLVAMQQSHGSNTKVINSSYKGRGARNWEDGICRIDGMITDSKKLVLLAMSADCSVIMFYDPHKKVLALAHSGWKGIAKGIIRNVIDIMEKRFSCERNHILVGIGPTICEKCYEIGGDVGKLFKDIFPFNRDTIFSRSIHGAKSLNLIKALELQLMQEGIARNNIETANLCTSCNSGEFFSYRRDNKNTGRIGMLAVLE